MEKEVSDYFVEGEDWKCLALRMLRDPENKRSYGVMGEEIGRFFRIKVTRSMVAGVAYRNNIKRPQPEARRPHLQTRSLADRRQDFKIVHRSKKFVTLKEPEPPKKPVGKYLELAKLGNKQCRWPITSHNTDPDKHLFCGERVLGTGSYCPYHKLAAVEPWRSRGLVNA